jgi:hypothetical protein
MEVLAVSKLGVIIEFGQKLSSFPTLPQLLHTALKPFL